MNLQETIMSEVTRQENRWGSFDNNRPSIRLGIACIEDEIAETREAYESDRRDDFCGLGFMATQEELVQTIAIGIRLLVALPNKLEVGK